MKWKQSFLIHLRSQCLWQKETWCKWRCKERNNDPLVSVLLYSIPKILHRKLVLVYETSDNRTNPFNRDWYCILITLFYPHATQKSRPILDNFCLLQGNCSIFIIQVYNHSALPSRTELTKLMSFLVECEWDVCSDCQIVFVNGMSFSVSLHSFQNQFVYWHKPPGSLSWRNLRLQV